MVKFPPTMVHYPSPYDITIKYLTPETKRRCNPLKIKKYAACKYKKQMAKKIIKKIQQKAKTFGKRKDTLAKTMASNIIKSEIRKLKKAMAKIPKVPFGKAQPTKLIGKIHTNTIKKLKQWEKEIINTGKIQEKPKKLFFKKLAAKINKKIEKIIISIGSSDITKEDIAKIINIKIRKQKLELAKIKQKLRLLEITKKHVKAKKSKKAIYKKAIADYADTIKEMEKWKDYLSSVKIRRG